MAVRCGAITTDPATKTVCVEIEIDNSNENPVQVTFLVCDQTLQVSKAVPVASPSSNLPLICAPYTVGPGMCVVKASALGAAGGSCYTEQALPV